MAGKGGGAWKVAYADFVTAMMAFFLVMWITAQSDSVKEAVAQYFDNPYAPVGSKGSAPATAVEGATIIGPEQSGRGRGKGATPDLSKEVPDPNREGNAGHKPPRFFIRQDTDHTRSGTMIVFADNSADLDAASREQLERIAPALLGKANKIEIRGHASRRPLPDGSRFDDAWQLSYARCLATMRFLVEAGIEPDRIRLSQAGIFEPYTFSSDPARQTQNSRVEIFALSEYVHEYEESHAGELSHDSTSGGDHPATAQPADASSTSKEEPRQKHSHQDSH